MQQGDAHMRTDIQIKFLYYQKYYVLLLLDSFFFLIQFEIISSGKRFEIFAKKCLYLQN